MITMNLTSNEMSLIMKAMEAFKPQNSDEEFLKDDVLELIHHKMVED